MLKYFMKYFRNISVFNEIFQNAMPFCTSGLFLTRRAMAYFAQIYNLPFLSQKIYPSKFLMTYSFGYLSILKFYTSDSTLTYRYFISS